MRKSHYQGAAKYCYKGIVIAATSYYSAAKGCTIVQLTTVSPITGKNIEAEYRQPESLDRENLGDYLSKTVTGTSFSDKLFAKYANAVVSQAPELLPNRCVLDCYYLLVQSPEYQRKLQKLLESGRRAYRQGQRKKSGEACKDTLPDDLLHGYLGSFGATPISKINAMDKKAAKAKMEQDPRYTQRIMQSCAKRLKLLLGTASYYGVPIVKPSPKGKEFDLDAQKRSAFGYGALSADELKRVLNILERDVREDGRAIGAACILTEGMTIEEACSAQFGNIITIPDYDGYSIQILRPYIVEKEGTFEFGEGKIYPYRIRKVPINAWLVQMMTTRFGSYEFDSRARVLPLACYRNQTKVYATCKQMGEYIKGVLERANLATATYNNLDPQTGRLVEKKASLRTRILLDTCTAIFTASQMRQGEINYMRGVAQTTTLDSVYVDYQAGVEQERIKRLMDAEMDKNWRCVG